MKRIKFKQRNTKHVKNLSLLSLVLTAAAPGKEDKVKEMGNL